MNDRNPKTALSLEQRLVAYYASERNRTEGPEQVSLGSEVRADTLAQQGPTPAGRPGQQGAAGAAGEARAGGQQPSIITTTLAALMAEESERAWREQREQQSQNNQQTEHARQAQGNQQCQRPKRTWRPRVPERDSACRPAPALGFAGFVASQARFIPRWLWVTQIALLALAVALACTSNSEQTTALGASLIGAALAAAGLPTIMASKSFGTAELECSCFYNCSGATAARLIILGCVDAFVLTCASILIPTIAGLPFVDTLLRLCFPFFLSAAGCLCIARKARPGNTFAWTASWTAFSLAATYVFAMAAPAFYESASETVWALASLIAGVWLTREAALIVSSAAQGLDAFRAMPAVAAAAEYTIAAAPGAAGAPGAAAIPMAGAPATGTAPVAGAAAPAAGAAAPAAATPAADAATTPTPDAATPPSPRL